MVATCASSAIYFMSPEMRVSAVLIDADEKIAIYRKKINI